MSIELTKTQKEDINEYMRVKCKECIDMIMEDDDFEADRDGFESLFERVIKLGDEIIIKSDKKEIKEKKEKKERKKTVNPWRNFLKIEQQKIREQYNIKGTVMKKASELWKLKSLEQKEQYRDITTLSQPSEEQTTDELQTDEQTVEPSELQTDEQTTDAQQTTDAM